MNTPTPALVTQRAAQRLPRSALLLFCLAYVVPGVFGRDPWRNADITAFGYMLGMAEGRSGWLTPLLGQVPSETALLPHWLGAAFVALLGPWMDPALAARLPFATLLALTLALTWYATFHLARTQAAQPVAFAFGGEAEPVDYARALADAAVLALIACLGLLQLGHETTPELAQLFGVSLLVWALAAAPYRPVRARAAAFAALLTIAGSGAPSMGLAMGLLGTLVVARSSHAAARKQWMWLFGATSTAALVATVLGAWAWRGSFEADATSWLQVARLWVWFLWPAWPLALWTLWIWRRHMPHRHLLVPLSTVVVALAASVWMGGSDRALMLGLPGMAVLAAFSLPTLRRSTSSAIDWFSMGFFSLCAIAIWVIYASMQTGIPAQPAANVARLVPGFAPRFSWLALAFAIAGTMAWLGLVRWRSARHRDALWKSLVLPAGGVALCWLLLMTLWLPLLDYARSSRPWAQRIVRQVPAGSCIAAPALRPPLVAALEVFGRYRVDARPAAARNSSCAFLVLTSRQPHARAAPPGWELQSEVRRPTDRDEITAIYRRTPH